MSGTPKYILTERVAQGGMAEIHLGKIVGSDGFSRVCAFKRILPHFAQDKEFIQMFRQEASVAKQLQNKNIVQVYDFVADDQSFMLVMEYVDGQDLRSLLGAAEEARRRIPVEVCCYIMIEVLSGLSYAHSALDVTGRSMNIIHRDVSPQNVLISYEGDIKITDFGIAKVQNSSGTTQAGVLKGKFRYMSPEQAMGKEIDARSDLFAAGVILYEMLTMTRLFKGEDMAVLEQVRRCVITPPTQVRNTRIPAELEAIVLKMLSRDPSQRYQSARGALRDLSRFLYGFRPDFYSGEVAEFMQLVFREKLASSRERLRSTLALPVDAIGRATKGMDVVAPESAFSSVVDVSGVDFAKAAGAGGAKPFGASTMPHSANRTPGRGPAQGGGLAGESAPPGVSGMPQAAASLPVLELGGVRRGHDFRGRSEGTRTRGGRTSAGRAQHGTVTGQRPALGGGTHSQTRVRRKSSRHLSIILVLTSLALIGLFAVALRRNEIPYTVSLEVKVVPTVPFKFELQGATGTQEVQVSASPLRFALKAGTYNLRVSRPGFTPQVIELKTAIFERSVRKSLVMEASGPLGELHLVTNPPGAKVTTRDGFVDDKTPSFLSFLPIGTPLLLDIKHPRCAPAQYRVELPRSAEENVLSRLVNLRDCK